ncbi:DUF6777 domain-containing protein [Streptomyces sp. NPDC014864]|uniref:DUF6777 domain-containing protein n=1 Tax=Streptomyces sp. NPDC014864 TaxID=3364924 RepID=UPI0036F9EDEA
MDNRDEPSRTKQENGVRTPSGTFATACALSVVLLVAGCVGGERTTRLNVELFLEAAAERGPDPFTDSSAISLATPPPATRTPQPAQPAPSVPRVPTVKPPSAPRGVRSLVGSTPGLYGGTPRVAACDVRRQISHLTADGAKAGAFAEVLGVAPKSLPGYLRGLTPVLLRADTRVTDHGFRDGRATTRQSVLQSGTAVLVDDHGVPRLRCVCGNPLEPPVAMAGATLTRGRPWSAYRSSGVVVVSPAPQALTRITIVDAAHGTWIERAVGQDVRRDRVVPPPRGADEPTWGETHGHGAHDGGHSDRPDQDGTRTETGPRVPPGDGVSLPPSSPAPYAAGQAPPARSGLSAPYGASGPAGSSAASDRADGLGPPALPDAPGSSDGGGPIPGEST